MSNHQMFRPPKDEHEPFMLANYAPKYVISQPIHTGADRAALLACNPAATTLAGAPVYTELATGELSAIRQLCATLNAVQDAA